MIDSGCQIPVVSNRLFGWCRDEAIGNVDLHGFGKDHTIRAPLVNLTVRLRGGVCECDVEREIPVVCAMTDLGITDYDVILPADVVRELQATDVSVNTLTCEVDRVVSVAEEAPVDSLCDRGNVIGVDSLHQNGLEGNAMVLISEQAGPTFHKVQVEGQPVSSQGRWDSVLRLTHESLCNQWEGPGIIAKNIWLICLVLVLVICMQIARCIVARVNDCSMINDCDSDFDRVLTLAAGVLSCVLPSNWIDEYELSHLESSQRLGFFRLLDEFPNRFTDTPGLCDAAVN